MAKRMKLRCPVCHSANSLEAYGEDAAQRQLLQLLAQSGPLFWPLVSYLGCFRSAQRDLAHSRALKLAKDVLQLQGDMAHGDSPSKPLKVLSRSVPDASAHQLAAALTETVEAMRAKRDQGDVRPLKNHNYLKRVLETVTLVAHGGSPSEPLKGLSPSIPSPLAPHPSQPKGRRAQAIQQLGQWAGDNWLRQQIGKGLATLIGLGRDGAPGVDTIVITAGLWEDFLIGKQVTIEQVDCSRIAAGFKDLIGNFEKWPEPKDLLARMPRRPDRHSLEAPISADDRAKGAAFFRTLQGGE